MNRSVLFSLMFLLGFAMLVYADDDIQLVIRGDDIGCAHSVNLACIDTYRNGIVRTVEIMVPTPWYPEAVKMINENPGLDIGVHLTLTSEWQNVKWRPLTKAVSFVDPHGYFFPMTWKNNNFPPNSSFLESIYDLKEVEAELRAQIETAVRDIPAVSHLSSHMGAASANDELKALTQKLAKEYGLPLGLPNTENIKGIGGSQTTPEEKERRMIQVVSELTPGLWHFVQHPGMDTLEMKGIWHKGYETVAQDREGVTRAFTSGKVKAIVKERGIKLMSYKDVYEMEK